MNLGRIVRNVFIVVICSNIILNFVRVSRYGKFGLLVLVECRGPSVVTIALRKSGRRCNICCTFENDNIAQFEILEH